MLDFARLVAAEEVGLRVGVVFPAVEPEGTAIDGAVVGLQREELHLRDRIVDVGLLSGDAGREVLVDLVLHRESGALTLDAGLRPRFVDAPRLRHGERPHPGGDECGGNPIILLIVLAEHLGEQADLRRRCEAPLEDRGDKGPLEILEVAVVFKIPVGGVDAVEELFVAGYRAGHVCVEMVVRIVADRGRNLLPLRGARGLRDAVDDSAESLGVAVEIGGGALDDLQLLHMHEVTAAPFDDVAETVEVGFLNRETANGKSILIARAA